MEKEFTWRWAAVNDCCCCCCCCRAKTTKIKNQQFHEISTNNTFDQLTCHTRRRLDARLCCRCRRWWWQWRRRCWWWRRGHWCSAEKVDDATQSSTLAQLRPSLFDIRIEINEAHSKIHEFNQTLIKFKLFFVHLFARAKCCKHGHRFTTTRFDGTIVHAACVRERERNLWIFKLKLRSTI